MDFYDSIFKTLESDEDEEKKSDMVGISIDKFSNNVKRFKKMLMSWTILIRRFILKGKLLLEALDLYLPDLQSLR